LGGEILAGDLTG